MGSPIAQRWACETLQGLGKPDIVRDELAFHTQSKLVTSNDTVPFVCPPDWGRIRRLRAGAAVVTCPGPERHLRRPCRHVESNRNALPGLRRARTRPHERPFERAPGAVQAPG